MPHKEKTKTRKKKTTKRSTPSQTASDHLDAIVQAIEAQCPFGPTFFYTQLRGFVRDGCPEASENWPTVELRLRSGECIQICHIIGVAPLYVALAVYEDDKADDPPAMRTELLPFDQIERVTVRPMQHKSPGFGFNVARVPSLVTQDSMMTPEQALRAAATGSSASESSHGKEPARSPRR